MIELTFEQLRSALIGARLSPERWSDLWAVLNEKKQADYYTERPRGQSAKRGIACGKLHPGVPSQWVPKFERRKTVSGEFRTYTVLRCYRCNTAYKNCTACHHQHRNRECYHKTNGVFDCECTTFVPYKGRR